MFPNCSLFEDLSISISSVISGAYFGDKMSPLSDTTNLAAAVSKVDLFKHIKYLTYTTIPSISITLIVFIILGINQSSSGVTDNSFLINTIENTFNISLVLFIVPIIVLITVSYTHLTLPTIYSV